MTEPGREPCQVQIIRPEDLAALRESVDAKFYANQLALEIAERQMEKSALALREQMDRSAGVLRDTLAAQIKAGDFALRAHVESQVQSVKDALMSLNMLLSEKDKAVDKAAALGERATDKADQAIMGKLELMNEFREQLNDQAKTFISREVFERRSEQMDKANDEVHSQLSRVQAEMLPREVYETRMGEIKSKLDSVGVEQATARGRQGSYAIIISVVIVVINVLGFFLT